MQDAGTDLLQTSGPGRGVHFIAEEVRQSLQDGRLECLQHAHTHAHAVTTAVLTS